MVLQVTPADRASFDRCRRQWDFGAQCRRNLEATQRPVVPDLAAALREALAVYYFPGMWDWQRSITLPLVVQGFERNVGRQRQAAGAGEDEAPWPEEREIGLNMLSRYFAWAPEVDTFSPVLVEAEYEANVPSPADPGAGLVTAAGEVVRYRGKLDMLAVDAHDAYWVVRHRVVTGPWPPTDDLLADTEMLTACWAWEQFYLGMAIEGIIYNELRPDPRAPGEAPAHPAPATRPATPPATPPAASPASSPATRRLGWLRGRRAAAGPPRRVRQHEPSGGGRSIPQHRRMYATASTPERLDAIEQRVGEDFRRTWLRRSPAEVAEAGQRLAREAAEMTSGPAIYPEPSLDNCPACEFLDPCLAMFAGQDAEAILASSCRDRPPDLPLEGRLGGGAWGVGRGAAPPRFGGR